jgi:hypothetical protein
MNSNAMGSDMAQNEPTAILKPESPIIGREFTGISRKFSGYFKKIGKYSSKFSPIPRWRILQGILMELRDILRIYHQYPRRIFFNVMLCHRLQ